MKEILRIVGGKRLNGEVSVSGGKNAAVAILPAALLTPDCCTIENVPDVADVHVLIELFKYLGVQVQFANHTMRIVAQSITSHEPPVELASRMRASYYLLPVLLARCGKAVVPAPGGCKIGERPIDLTLRGIESLGASIYEKDGFIYASADELVGAEVFFNKPSVGATINTMLAAVFAKGKTIIHNPAREPHVVDVANFLCAMGADIRGAGAEGTIRINGGKPLHAARYQIVPDQIETGTLMIAAATGGKVRITGVVPTHMEALTAKLREMGIDVAEEETHGAITVRSSGYIRHANVETNPYPRFPTDLQQPITALLSVADTEKSDSVVRENIYESRFGYVEELRKMGACIDLLDNRTAVIKGVNQLHGTRVEACDLRAGAALIVAALMADGVTEICGLEHILRGYERIDEKLHALGADIQRVWVD